MISKELSHEDLTELIELSSGSFEYKHEASAVLAAYLIGLSENSHTVIDVDKVICDYTLYPCRGDMAYYEEPILSVGQYHIVYSG